MSQTIAAADIAIQLENADITAAELTLEVLADQTNEPTEQLLAEVREIMFPATDSITADTPAGDIVAHLEHTGANWQGEGIDTIAIGDLRVWQAGGKGEWLWRTFGCSVGGTLDSFDELDRLIAAGPPRPATAS